MNLAKTLTGAVVMGPMTRGSNLPYRRLCVELGARVTVSEMTVARRLKQKRRAEFALIRRAPDEPCFAVQLAGTNPEEMGWAAALVEARGADFVDVNLGCPIDHFTRKGLGAALSRQPARVGRIVGAMVQAVDAGTDDGQDPARLERQEPQLPRGGTRGGRRGGAGGVRARAHARRALSPRGGVGRDRGDRGRAAGAGRRQRRSPLRPRDRERPRARRVRRRHGGPGALIKPWIFREAVEGYRDLPAEERLAIYRRYVALALEHWGDDEHGRSRARDFLVWHLGFWCRYAPRRDDGSYPTMQEREARRDGLTPLDAMLARTDADAHRWLADRLLAGDEIVVDDAPPLGGAEAASLLEAAG